jgi:hypothetical protein
VIVISCDSNNSYQHVFRIPQRPSLRVTRSFWLRIQISVSAPQLAIQRSYSAVFEEEVRRTIICARFKLKFVFRMVLGNSSGSKSQVQIQ